MTNKLAQMEIVSEEEQQRNLSFDLQGSSRSEQGKMLAVATENKKMSFECKNEVIGNSLRQGMQFEVRP